MGLRVTFPLLAALASAGSLAFAPSHGTSTSSGKARGSASAKPSASAAPKVPPTASPSAVASTAPKGAPAPAPSAVPSKPAGETEPLSPAMMGIGYTLAVLGAAGLVVGGVIYVSAHKTYTNCMGAPCSGSPPDASRRFDGTVTMIAGAIGFGIGLPIGIIGSVPVEAEPKPKASAAVRVGPTGVTLVGRW